MLRRLLAVIVGIVIGAVVIGLIQGVLAIISPPPAELDWQDTEAINAYISQLPVWKLLLVVVSYIIGAWVAGFAAARITDAQPDLVGGICGVGLTIFALMNLISYDHPWWFWILALIVSIPSALLGAKAGAK